MSEADICTKIVIEILRTLKNECEKTSHCSTCKLYNQNTGDCLLKEYPEYYDLLEIEKRLIEIIEDELKDGEKK